MRGRIKFGSPKRKFCIYGDKFTCVYCFPGDQTTFLYADRYVFVCICRSTFSDFSLCIRGPRPIVLVPVVFCFDGFKGVTVSLIMHVYMYDISMYAYT